MDWVVIFKRFLHEILRMWNGFPELHCAAISPCNSNVYWSAQAAITKSHKCGDCNSKYLFCTVVEPGGLKILFPAILTLVRDPYDRERTCLVSVPLFVRTMITSWGPLPSWPHVHLITSQRPHLQIQITSGVRASAHESSGVTNVQSITNSHEFKKAWSLGNGIHRWHIK